MIPKWLEATDEGTWQGHLLVALVLFWPGYALGRIVAAGFSIDNPVLAAGVAGTLGVLTGLWGVAMIFFYRESDNMRAAIKKFGARLAFQRKGLDGIGDFLFPLLGVFCDINLTRSGVGGGLAGFIACLVGTEIVWLLIVAKKRRGDVLSVFRGK